MAISYASFVAAYPEFSPIDQPYVQSWLDAAGRQIDRDVFETCADDAQGLLAAHLLALSPYGRNARTEKPQTTSVYGTMFADLQLKCSYGYRVAI